VQEDLEAARSLMRQLGCIVIRTDNRAIEETAAEILRYYSAAHPE
jgi:regulator of PEP synthase PpsR (kinase-PPPase family)